MEYDRNHGVISLGNSVIADEQRREFALTCPVVRIAGYPRFINYSWKFERAVDAANLNINTMLMDNSQGYTWICDLMLPFTFFYIK